MTYNIKRPHTKPRADYPPDGRPWSKRKSRIISLLRTEGADVFGLQETTACAPKHCGGVRVRPEDDIAKGVGSNYRHLPDRPDDGTNTGVPKTIFYRSDRFELVRGGYRNFVRGNARVVKGKNPCRITTDKRQRGSYAVAWVDLRRKSTGQRYFVMNTHLSPVHNCWHYNHQATGQIKNEIYLKNTSKAPTIVMGDFNSFTKRCTPANRKVRDSNKQLPVPGAAMTNLTQPTYWFDLDLELDPNACKRVTFNAGPAGARQAWDNKTSNDVSRIDYVARSVSPASAKLKVLGRRVVTDAGGYSYTPSDHYPLIVRLQLAQ